MLTFLQGVSKSTSCMNSLCLGHGEAWETLYAYLCEIVRIIPTCNIVSEVTRVAFLNPQIPRENREWAHT